MQSLPLELSKRAAPQLRQWVETPNYGQGTMISINYARAEMRWKEDHLQRALRSEPGILSKIRTTAASLIESSAPCAEGDSRELVCYDDI